MSGPRDEVVNALGRGQALVIVGAGVSIGATGGQPRVTVGESSYPVASWVGLLYHGVEACEQWLNLPKKWAGVVRDEISLGDLESLLSAATKIENQLEAPEGGLFKRWLRASVGALTAQNTDVLKAIAALGAPIATTNYDGLIESVTGLPAITWRDGNDVERVLRGEDSAVIHLHGFWKKADSVVLGHRSYDHVVRDPNAQALLRATFATRTVILVGFGGGLDDPNFGPLLVEIREAFQGSELPRFRLKRDGEAGDPKAEFPIVPLNYGAGHEDLAPFLRELAPRSTEPGPKKILTPRTREASGADEDVSITRLPKTGPHLFGRDEELKRLDEAWAVPGTHVVSLVAWGGVGKTSLVKAWLLRRMRPDRYRGAERVFAWSFYRQGVNDLTTSADPFMDAALKWFGDPSPKLGTPWSRGLRLAELVRARRTLLVLDGLEPLQYPPGRRGGDLTEQAEAVRALLLDLAIRNPGLCVLTTRLAVSDLAEFETSSALRIDLDHLSNPAGAQLLRALGVRGSDDELEKASEDFGGHGLALTLLGTYLCDVCGGEVGRREEEGLLRGGAALLDEDEQQEGLARQVMASYERWFGHTGHELAVLRLLGLFDRPADPLSVAALRNAAIPGLTDTLSALREADWRRVLARLRRASLLAASQPGKDDTLDTHPLVREYFGRQLRANPEAWRRGHDCLYEHLKRTAKDLPENVQEMSPLYTAVAHGCQAGRHRDALDEVYRRRIQRGDGYFNTKILGALGAELATLAHFFDPPWTRTVDGLDESDRCYVLNEAGFDLAALGRLKEAEAPQKAALQGFLALEEWRKAVESAGYLSALYLASGDLTQSIAYARQAVALVDRSQDLYQAEKHRGRLARALTQAGQFEEAEATYRRAEELQGQRRPDRPILASFWGSGYCDLLLARGDDQAALDRARLSLKWAREDGVLLDIALNFLTLGLAHTLQARRDGRNDSFHQGQVELETAVDRLRATGLQYEIPQGLIARAELHRLMGRTEKATADLAEARTIADRGGMRLHQVDCHLAFARLHLDNSRLIDAFGELALARKLIRLTGYHRRDAEVAELERLLQSPPSESQATP